MQFGNLFGQKVCGVIYLLRLSNYLKFCVEVQLKYFMLCVYCIHIGKRIHFLCLKGLQYVSIKPVAVVDSG